MISDKVDQWFDKIYISKQFPVSTLLASWLLVSFFPLLIGTVLTGTVIELIFFEESTSISVRFDRFMEYFLGLSFGLLIMVVSPLGWINVGGMVLSIIDRRLSWQIYSAISSLFAGGLWPFIFHALISM